MAREAGWAFAGAVVGAAIGALGTIWTSAFGYWNKDRELDIQMVNIALSILGGENKETSLPGRKFAVDLLETYSRVPIDDGDALKWAETGTLPPDVWRPGWGQCPVGTYRGNDGQCYTDLPGR